MHAVLIEIFSSLARHKIDLVSIQPYATYTQLRYSSSQPDAAEVYLVTKKNSISFRDAF